MLPTLPRDLYHLLCSKFSLLCISICCPYWNDIHCPFIDTLWFPKGVPGHTNARLDEYTVRYCREHGIVIISNPQQNLSDKRPAKSNGSNIAVSSIVEGQNHANNPDNELFSMEFLYDWKKVSTDFKEFFEKYHKIGKQVQVYQKLFQTWFIIPWVIYFINSSLKTYNVLRPWNLDGMLTVMGTHPLQISQASTTSYST